MVRILGNLSERVPIKDLKDVVYYRQIKEYTNEEYEASRDLRNAISSGKLALLSRTEPVKGDAVSSQGNGGAIKASDLRSLLREILPDLQGPGMDAKGLASEMAPIVADIVRQELARMPVGYAPAAGTVAHQTPAFMGPEYVPTVTTEGLTSNVEAKATEKSGSEADDALAALRKLQGIQ